MCLSYFINSNYLLLVNESSTENMIISILKEFTRRYDKIQILIANMPSITKGSSLKSKKDPQVNWKVVRSCAREIIDGLSSASKSQDVKLWSLRFLETMLLFALPLGEKQPIAVRADPRLARSAKPVVPPTSSSAAQSTASDFSFTSSTTYTAEMIPLHHPFINRNELILEAEEVMSKALIWLTSNKGADSSQGMLFTPSLMAILAEVVANVAAARPKYCNNAAAAIAFMISTTSLTPGKAGSEVCQQMSASVGTPPKVLIVCYNIPLLAGTRQPRS